MNKQERFPETFAERLKKHNAYCGKLTNQIKILLKQARDARKEGNTKKGEQLMKRTEKAIELVNNAMHEFETEDGETLKKLEYYLDSKGN